jgi:3-oxoacyl-[acyl-carrier-protein] synthase II
MQAGYVPEIRNLSDPCHEELNFVRESSSSSNTCIIENFGFGGQNAALVVRQI